MAWEIRGKVSDRTTKLMSDLGIIHCTDISREMPAVDSDIMYTRLFGHGEHNLYSDSARLKVYERSGTFPKVTKAAGLASLKIVLEEDIVFLATKSELIEDQGWNVFDLTEKEHVHARLLLENLPNGKYSSVEEVLEDLQ
ncbi:MAG: hypothetical protein J5U17_07450 [Candidatus Methanoperedens sp.]|nr:hypothetical protein [Candidatus Methanoperedens sp.]MCE8427621.1 hypothetical protein [Candidatus Methanoperedens sp.]